MYDPNYENVKKHPYDDNIIRFKANFMTPIANGIKRSTIRKGFKLYSLGYAVARSSNISEPDLIIDIKSVTYKLFDDLSNDDAHMDGYLNREYLKYNLKDIYPDIKNTDMVTIVGFNLYKKTDLELYLE